MPRWTALTVTVVLLAGCASGDPARDGPPPASVRQIPTTTAGASTTATTAGASTTTTTTPGDAAVEIRYRVERRTTDAATADFERVVAATLTDPRGWQRAGFAFVRDDSRDAPYLLVLAEGDEVDRLCLPYDTYGEYSCQNGPVVALNANRWRLATSKWTGDIATYRQMLVNHEVGHLLGMRHPRPQCPSPGAPAPIMNQQSTELDGCLPNPWPLDAEIADAARHDRKLAPGPGE
ncbi:MAG TPA: DUF3152 domain-containing protein [Acidimicrobiales bacterium]